MDWFSEREKNCAMPYCKFCDCADCEFQVLCKNRHFKHSPRNWTNPIWYSAVNDDWNYFLGCLRDHSRAWQTKNFCVILKTKKREEKNALNQSFSMKWTPPKLEFIFYATKQRRFYFFNLCANGMPFQAPQRIHQRQQKIQFKIFSLWHVVLCHVTRLNTQTKWTAKRWKQ